MAAPPTASRMSAPLAMPPTVATRAVVVAAMTAVAPAAPAAEDHPDGGQTHVDADAAADDGRAADLHATADVRARVDHEARRWGDRDRRSWDRDAGVVAIDAPMASPARLIPGGCAPTYQ